MSFLYVVLGFILIPLVFSIAWTIFWLALTEITLWPLMAWVGFWSLFFPKLKLLNKKIDKLVFIGFNISAFDFDEAKRDFNIFKNM